MTTGTGRGWDEIRADLMRREPAFYELEPGGSLGLTMGDDGWMLELTPDGRLICQVGMDMEDIQCLLSDGTPEDLGTDELAKQAKYYLQPSVAKFRQTLVTAGFQESTQMTDEFVAVLFERPVSLDATAEVIEAVQWCRRHFR